MNIQPYDILGATGVFSLIAGMAVGIKAWPCVLLGVALLWAAAIWQKI